MLFKFKKINILILSIIYSFNIFIASSEPEKVHFFDMQKINKEYKPQIERKIKQFNYLKYTLGTIGLIGVAFGVYKYFFNKKDVTGSLDITKLNDNQTKLLKDLLEAIKSGKIVLENDSKFKKAVDFLGPNLIYSFIPPTVFNLLNYFGSNYNLKWFIQKYNILNILENLKTQALILDIDSEVLNMTQLKVNIDQKINSECIALSMPNFDELVKFIKIANTIRINTLSIKDIESGIKNLISLSNNLIDSLSYILAYLNYLEEVYLSNQTKYQRIKQLNDSLRAQLNEYCARLSKILSNINSNTLLNKNNGIFAIIMNFSNQFYVLINSSNLI